MKTIENKTTNLSKNANENIKYSDLAISCVSLVNPQQGMKGDEMYKNFKLIDKIEACANEEKIVLEDAECELLKLKVSSMSWGMMHREIVDFCEMIKNV